MQDNDLLMCETSRTLHRWQRRCKWVVGALCIALLAGITCLYWQLREAAMITVTCKLDENVNLFELVTALNRLGLRLHYIGRHKYMATPYDIPAVPERHGNLNVFPIREYRHINWRAVPKGPENILK